MLIECVDFLAPLRDHPRYRSHLQQLGIPEGVVRKRRGFIMTLVTR